MSLKISGMTEVFNPLDTDSLIELSTSALLTRSTKIKNIPSYEVYSATDNYVISKDDGMKVLLSFTRQTLGKTITLPDATTNIGQSITIQVTGAAVGNVSLAGTGSQTINGVIISSWVFQGEGTLSIISDGANYIAMTNHMWDSGAGANDNFEKYTDNKMVQYRSFTVTESQTTAFGTALFRAATVQNITFDKPFITTVPWVVITCCDSGAGSSKTLYTNSCPTLTQSGGFFGVGVVSAASITFKYVVIAEGRWV